MRPIFTVHAGEYLVGSHFEKNYRNINVWVPSKDTGTDILLSSNDNRKTVSIQVKYSKDFLITHLGSHFQKQLKSFGWWTLKQSKIKASKSDYWVFALHSFNGKNIEYVIIKPSDLLARLKKLHGNSDTVQMYLWITKGKKCWETRGLNKPEQEAIAKDTYSNADRDFTQYLNDWDSITKNL